jgi:hypothetical protein
VRLGKCVPQFLSAARSLFAGVHVGRDFHAQANFFKFRFDPFHIFILFESSFDGIRHMRFIKKNFDFQFLAVSLPSCARNHWIF